MSRYLILIILNTPPILAGVVSGITAYKLSLISRRRLAFRLLFWLTILAGIAFAQPIYAFLFSNQLTRTEPLSLFDVIQITGIIFTLFIANEAYTRNDALERRVQDLHQELSIRIGDNKQTKR